MRTRNLILAAVAALLAAPAAASADAAHVVARGETLTSVAAADGLSVTSLAAANGLSADAELTAGTTLNIPPRGRAIATAAVSATPAAAAAPAPGGGYIVQLGDTLTAIAARYGLTVGGLAAANGMSPSDVLEAGRTLALADGSSPAVVAPASTTTAAQASGAQPTQEYVSASEIGSIASEEGVAPSLAEALAYQESGFNNAEVSATGATGVMQIEPGTWTDLAALGGPALSPDSAADNIRGGVELLRALLADTGGDAREALAAYYQGLSSVRDHGMFRGTRHYVADILALQSRFGG